MSVLRRAGEQMEARATGPSTRPALPRSSPSCAPDVESHGRERASASSKRQSRRGGDRREPSPRRSVERAAKRGLDVLGAGIFLLASLPALTLAASAIALEDGRPVLFVQRRAGRHGRPFRIVKLRTMKVNDADPEALGEVRASHALVLKVGAFLRRLKIDELPQLWNVLAGDMSLVGPRPTLPEQVARYDAFDARRLEVRPGLSGWAQVNGNVELSWQERILLDVWYVDHWSLALDLKILAMTVARVFARSGISCDGHATMPEFRGTGRDDAS